MRKVIDISTDASDSMLASDFNHTALVWRCYPSEADRNAAWDYFQATQEAPAFAIPEAHTGPALLRVA
jgi:hypothetical protein